MPSSTRHVLSVQPVTSKAPSSEGARFRHLRVLAGLPLSELARRINVNKGQISEFENGARGLSPERMALAMKIVRAAMRRQSAEIATAMQEDREAVGA